NKAQIGKVQQKKNERPKQTGQLYKTLWVDSPIEAKTVEKDNATNHHIDTRFENTRQDWNISFPGEVTSEIRHRQRQFSEEPPMQRSIAETKRNRIIDLEKISPSSIDPSDSDEEKPAKRVLRKPPLPRDKSRTIIGGCNAGGKAGREHRNRKPKTKKQQTFSSS
ncbi:LOW QUALITY PROTEIN: hypothetical protein HID58_015968, partial [Brassica napus]